jgi:hypothetical protein
MRGDGVRQALLTLSINKKEVNGGWWGYQEIRKVGMTGHRVSMHSNWVCLMRNEMKGGTQMEVDDKIEHVIKFTFNDNSRER